MPLARGEQIHPDTPQSLRNVDWIKSLTSAFDTSNNGKVDPVIVHPTHRLLLLLSDCVAVHQTMGVESNLFCSPQAWLTDWTGNADLFMQVGRSDLHTHTLAAGSSLL